MLLGETVIRHAVLPGTVTALSVGVHEASSTHAGAHVRRVEGPHSAFVRSGNVQCSALLLDSILAEAPQPPQPLACAARASLWICGQRKGVAHMPHRRSKQKQASIYRRRKGSVRPPRD